MRLSCPWWKARDDDARRGPKSVNIFLGFFFVVNFCLGTGFLGIPYAFFYTGFPAAIPTLLLIAFVSWNCAVWEIEVMARAQAVESFKHSQRSGSGSDSEKEDSYLSDSSCGLFSSDVDGHPRFEIRLSRKFEPTELCEVFFNRWGKYLYMLVMIVYCFLTGWSYSTVAGSAWATNIPFNFGGLEKCESTAFQHNLIPEHGGCVNAYRFCLFLFAVVVISLAMVDLKEQAVVQMVLGMLRFATIVAIVLYSIVKLFEGGNPCEETHSINYTNMSASGGSGELFEDKSFTNWSAFANSSKYDLTDDLLLGFDVKGWLVAIPVFTYAFIIHQGIPSLTHPIKQKRFLRSFMVVMFGVAAVCYLALGITVSLWFRGSIQETATLNWVSLSGPENSPQLRALSYYLVLFPSLDVCSAYPLVVHAITNNIYTVVVGRDTTKKSKSRFDWPLQLIMRFIVAVLPIIAALFISNLVYILKYAGLIGFGICFFFPTALQLQSQRVCKRLFGVVYVSSKNSFSTSESTETNNRKEHSPLLSLQEKTKQGSSLYMTPFSNRLLSHPITVVVLGVIGLLFFLLAIVSLAIHPDRLTCLATTE